MDVDSHCSHVPYVNYENETEEKVLSVFRSDNLVCDLKSALKVCTS